MRKFLVLVVMMTSLAHSSEEEIWDEISAYLEQVNASPMISSSEISDGDYFWPDHILDDLPEPPGGGIDQDYPSQVIKPNLSQPLTSTSQSATFHPSLWHGSFRFTPRDFQLVIKMRGFLNQYFDDESCFTGDKKRTRRELKDYMSSDVSESSFQRALSCLYNYGTKEELAKYRQISPNTNWKYGDK
jgi:hypothetical protein